MADSSSIDRRSGYNTRTKTFHSIRPSTPLPPASLPLSFPSFSFSLLLSSSASSSSSRPLYIDSLSLSSISSSHFLSQVASLSFSLRSRFHLSKSDVAFILTPPLLHTPVLYFSLLSLGVVISPSNPTSSPSEISRQIALAKPTIAFAVSSTAALLPPSLPVPLLLDSPSFPSLLQGQANSIAESHQETIYQSDPAAILFSSGTTGAVKGVTLSHGNLIAAATIASGAPGKVLMVTVPLFHVFGFVCLVRAVAAGQTMVIMAERFDVERVAKVVERFRVVNLLVAPPAVLRMVRELEEGKLEGVDLTSLEVVYTGGAGIGVDLIRRFLAGFPYARLGQGYGLTESTAGIFRTASPEECRCIGSVGRLASCFEAKIVDPSTGIGLPPYEQGELWVRGPTIMKGYVGDKEATSAILDSEGWLKTGDLCYIDSDGLLFVVDRLKELIKYNGYQVPPAELEHLLQTHNDIIEAAVIPYPDEDAGQIPMAFIVREPNSKIGEAEIMEFVARQVAPYKKIRRVSFVNSIPKNPTGKILRKELVKVATTNIGPRILCNIKDYSSSCIVLANTF